MKKLSESILNKINEEGISPRPRWEFLLKDGVLWGGFVLSVILGSVSMSLILFLIKTGDLDLLKVVYGSTWGGIISVIPYFWGILLFVFIFVAFLNYRFTNGGYRFRHVYVFLVGLLLSVVVGALLFFGGMARWLHGELVLRMPLYERMHPRQEILWLKPDNGLLVGVVSGLHEDDTFDLITPNSEIWLVDCKNAKISKRVSLDINTMIKIIGRKKSEKTFEAFEIRPFERPSFSRPIIDFERKKHKLAY